MDQYNTTLNSVTKDASLGVMTPGTMFDKKFRIIKHLGEGYCSHVYLAEDLHADVGLE